MEEVADNNSGFGHTQMAVDIFSRLAKQYQEKFMDVGIYHNGLDCFCSALKENAAVLELACGPGNITHYLLNKRSDLNILATDLSEEMLKLARITTPSAKFEIMDIRDIGKFGKQFDGIVCGFGLPYISKEEAIQLIRDASKALHPNGVIYISTMEDDYSKSGLETTSSGNTLFIYYHQEDYLKEALLSGGFNILATERRDSANGGKPVTDLIIVARKDKAT